MNQKSNFLREIPDAGFFFLCKLSKKVIVTIMFVVHIFNTASIKHNV